MNTNTFALTLSAQLTKAATVAQLLAEEQIKVDVCRENMEACINPRELEYWQECGDIAAGNCMMLQVELYKELRAAVSPIVFREDRQANVVSISEAFYSIR